MSKAVVFGLARSGLGAANLLAAMGRNVTVTDIRPNEELSETIKQLSPTVEVIAGGHPSEMFKDADLIVVSPGIPMNIEPLKRARAEGIEIIGELELAYRLMNDIPFYAVTGTNGKSTTVTLLDLMMRKSGRRSLLGGNIGTPLTAELVARGNGGLRLKDIDCVVVEVSSFQLESIVSFRPTGAAILNISPDHLDRYQSMKDYKNAKTRIVLNQGKDDFVVLNADDPETMDLSASFPTGVQVAYFSRKRAVDGVYVKGGKMFFGRDVLMRPEDIGIQGVHNLENAMAASAMALLAGCPFETVAEALMEFQGLEHRLEFVREVNGVSFINDSKGTNVGAVIKSIESFSSLSRGSVILIAGGRDKNGDFDKLAEAAGGAVKAAVLIGESRQKIKDALGGTVECTLAVDFEEAVNEAASLASPGDVVLLSPACASFDMFKDFEDRGRQFKALVERL